MSVKILVVTPDFPYPPNHGARLDIWRRCLILKELGCELDLLATVKTEPDNRDIKAARECFRQVSCCPVKFSPASLLELRPLQLSMRRSLRDVFLAKAYDLVLLESEFVLPVLDNPQLRAGQAAIRVHNDEVVYFKELARSGDGLLRKLYYWSEAARFAWMRPLACRRLQYFLFIANDEYRRFLVHSPGRHAVYLPPALPVCCRTAPLAAPKALFIGSLFMINNREAVNWYLQEVHQQLFDVQGYELIIAGNTRGQRDAWLAKLTRQKKVSFVDTPEDLMPLYNSAGVFINPILHGAGVKLKLIDAIANGLPVVSTRFGAQGSALVAEEHVYIADEPTVFAKAVRRALTQKEKAAAMVARAQRFLQTAYDQRALLSHFLADIPPSPATTDGEGSKDASSR